MTIQYFTAKEICQSLNLSKTTLYGLIKNQRFPRPLKFGRSSRWRADEVQHWLTQQTTAQQGANNGN